MDDDNINILENSLSNYLISSSESLPENFDSSKRMKYRGLSITLDSREDEPAFKVRIGAFEGSFRIKDGLKIHGSLCGDEKLVIKWYLRGSNQELMHKVAKNSSQIKMEFSDSNYVETDLKLEAKDK